MLAATAQVVARSSPRPHSHCILLPTYLVYHAAVGLAKLHLPAPSKPAQVQARVPGDGRALAANLASWSLASAVPALVPVGLQARHGNPCLGPAGPGVIVSCWEAAALALILSISAHDACPSAPVSPPGWTGGPRPYGHWGMLIPAAVSRTFRGRLETSDDRRGPRRSSAATAQRCSPPYISYDSVRRCTAVCILSGCLEVRIPRCASRGRTSPAQPSQSCLGVV